MSDGHLTLSEEQKKAFHSEETLRMKDCVFDLRENSTAEGKTSAAGHTERSITHLTLNSKRLRNYREGLLNYKCCDETLKLHVNQGFFSKYNHYNQMQK